MTTNPEMIASALLRQQADRQKVVELMMGRSKWFRLQNWLPTIGALAMIVGTNAWTGGRSEYGVLISLMLANVIGLSVSQAQAAKRLNAIGRILERSGTIDRFILGDVSAAGGSGELRA